MHKSDQHGKPLQKPMRRMSMFTASQTMYAVTGWRNQMPGSRRQSVWRRDSVRTDGSSLQQQPTAKPVVQLENTFKTEPDEGAAFQEWKIRKHMEDIMKEQLHTREYDETEMQRLSLQICSMIKQQAKDMGCPRYKFVSHVIIAQNLGQSAHSVSRGLWDSHFDGYACATYKNESLFAVATLFGVYYD